MDRNQANIIILLLAAILFVLALGRSAAHELVGDLFWVLVAVFVVGAVALSLKAGVSGVINWRHSRKQKKLSEEITELARLISVYPGPPLTTEHIPQRFPSKEMAQAFGERWSRGGRDSFSAKAIDVQGRDEHHPDFDKSLISGGILYTYPALFFGLAEAHREDEAWWLEFCRAKRGWLGDYLEHLKKSSH